MIPFDISGTVRIPTGARTNFATVKAVAKRLEDLLYEADVSKVFVEGGRVRYRNAWFGGTFRFGFSDYGRSFLTITGPGTFDIEAAIDSIAIRFRLSLTRTWLPSLVIFAATFFFLSRRHAPDWDAMVPAVWVAMAALLVLQCAYFWGRTWFWLKRGLKDVSE